MDRRRLRDEAMKVLENGGSYRDALETAAVMGALDDAPEIKLIVPIRFRKRYEDMHSHQTEENDGTDLD